MATKWYDEQDRQAKDPECVIRRSNGSVTVASIWLGEQGEISYYDAKKKYTGTQKRMPNDLFAHMMSSYTANGLDPMHYFGMYSMIQANPAMEFMVTPFPIARAFAEHVKKTYCDNDGVLTTAYVLKNEKWEKERKETFSLLDPMTGTGSDCWAMMCTFEKNIYVQACNYDTSTIMEEINIFQTLQKAAHGIHKIEQQLWDAAQTYREICVKEALNQGAIGGLQTAGDMIDRLIPQQKKAAERETFRSLREACYAQANELREEWEKDKKEAKEKSKKDYSALKQIYDKQAKQVGTLANDNVFSYARLDITSIDDDLDDEQPTLPFYDMVYLDPPWPGTYVQQPHSDAGRQEQQSWSHDSQGVIFEWSEDPNRYMDELDAKYQIGSKGDLFTFIKKIFDKQKTKMVAVKFCKFALLGENMTQDIQELHTDGYQVDYKSFDSIKTEVVISSKGMKDEYFSKHRVFKLQKEKLGQNQYTIGDKPQRVFNKEDDTDYLVEMDMSYKNGGVAYLFVYKRNAGEEARPTITEEEKRMLQEIKDKKIKRIQENRIEAQKQQEAIENDHQMSERRQKKGNPRSGSLLPQTRGGNNVQLDVDCFFH